MSSNLTIHPSVTCLVLHSSRGLAGGCWPDSDIDLSLIIDPPPRLAQPELELLLQEVIETTLNHWQSDIEADLAVVFDIQGCGLKGFDQTAWSVQTCATGGVDCFGLYKVQKGFGGLVTNAGV